MRVLDRRTALQGTETTDTFLLKVTVYHLMTQQTDQDVSEPKSLSIEDQSIVSSGRVLKA